MNYLLLILSAFIFAIQTICFKDFNRSIMKSKISFYLYNVCYYLIVVLILLIIHPNLASIHLMTVYLAIPFGVIFVTTILLYMKAMEKGPLSFSVLTLSFGILIPIICGFLFWKEKVGIQQVIALALLFITLYLGNQTTRGSSKKFNISWFLYIISAMIGNGAVLTIVKAHQEIFKGSEIYEFLDLAFGTAAFLSLILYIVRRIAGDKIISLNHRRFILLVFGAAVTTAFGNVIALYLASRISAVIQFPFVNGGSVIIASIFSVIIFKEKLSKEAVFGLTIGLTALILMGIR